MSAFAGSSKTPMKCPVCSASFRDAETCPRCATDLKPLMQIAARAWALREQARAQIIGGDISTALQTIAAARKQVDSTPVAK